MYLWTNLWTKLFALNEAIVEEEFAPGVSVAAFEAGEDVEEAVKSEEEGDSAVDQPSVEFVDYTYLHSHYIADPHTPFSCSCVHPECPTDLTPSGQLRLEALIFFFCLEHSWSQRWQKSEFGYVNHLP